MFASVISVLTIIFSFLVKVVGFPAQIKLLLTHNETANISKTFYLLNFISYFLWTVHGVNQGDKIIIIGQGLGVIASGIVLYLLFRRTKNGP
jgi:hypothetical protein